MASDWTRDDVKEAIRRTGLSCRQLSLRNGFSQIAVVTALTRPWPAVEGVIAKHLGLSPASIWPSRYDAQGQPKHGGWAYPNRRLGASHRQNGEAA